MEKTGEEDVSGNEESGGCCMRGRPVGSEGKETSL